jgi:hypothetical protein
MDWATVSTNALSPKYWLFNHPAMLSIFWPSSGEKIAGGKALQKRLRV